MPQPLFLSDSHTQAHYVLSPKTPETGTKQVETGFVLQSQLKLFKLANPLRAMETQLTSPTCHTNLLQSQLAVTLLQVQAPVWPCPGLPLSLRDFKKIREFFLSSTKWQCCFLPPKESLNLFQHIRATTAIGNRIQTFPITFSKEEFLPRF